MKPQNSSRFTPRTTRFITERDRAGSAVPPAKRKAKNRAHRKAAKHARKSG
jgi:hypothetical protein